MSYFPLFLDISNTKFLVVGAGNIAFAKLESLVDFGANVKIVSKDIITPTQQLIDDNNLLFIKDSYDKKYLNEIDIVIGATDDDAVNALIAKEAREVGITVNIVDDPKNSDFIFGSYVKKGNIMISAGTSGMSPVMARILKQRFNRSLPQNLDLFDQFVISNKDKVREKLTDLQARRVFWQDVFEGVVGNEIEAGNISLAQKLFDNKFDEKQNKQQGAVYFIGAGPGDPELITLKGINLLSRADVVLYDRLVSEEILTYARKDAIKINVGKKRDFHRYKQAEIDELIKDYALKGNIVARLKGGDATIFAHLSEEIAIISDLNIPYQVVPGVTAASAAGAMSGIPLTSRDSNKSVRFLTIYEKDLFNADYFKNLAESNDSLVLYMSSHNLGVISKNLIKAGKNQETPVAIIEQSSTPYQKTHITTLVDFEKDFGTTTFVSPSLCIIGEVVNQHKNFKWKEENLSGTYFKNPRKREANVKS
jgi:uroporphyrin-III C-methyltransferase/precorrin-2 dehydrogenase/sirohydrochlorin ferrochelatase